MTDPLVSTDPDERARYSQGGGIYRIIPAAVARPRNLRELRDVLAHARTGRLAVTCRGAGSAMDGSSVGAGVIMDMSRFDAERCTVEPDALRATASPSVTVAALNAAASAHGLRMPVDPSSAAWATLGGAVSTNASGARTLQVGSMRQWITGVTIETVDGPLNVTRGMPSDPGHPVMRRWSSSAGPLVQRHREEIGRRYPRVRKNSAGYALDHYVASGDLLDVVIGSEGTLGVITDVTVRLEPAPAHRVSVRVAVGERAALPSIIERLRTGEPSTIELLDGSFLRLVARQVSLDPRDLLERAAGVLLMDLEGDDAAVLQDRAEAVARDVAADVLDVRVAIDRAEIESLWDIRHRASPILAGLTDGRRSLQVIEDGCVPVARLADYLDVVEAASLAQRIDVVMFGHAGDGHVHVNLLPNLRDDDWLVRVRAIFDAVSQSVIALGGTPSGEHGTGRLRAGWMPVLYGPEVMECFRAVRGAFDPTGAFGPGVIISDGSDPLSRLKVGRNAVSLPAGIDGMLQRVEAQALWGRPL